MPYLPRVSYANHLRASIDDYHEDFATIWSRDAGERSVFDLWLHVVDHASRVGRAVRRQRPVEVIDDIADTTVWLFSFIAHCRNATNPIDTPFRFDLLPSDIIWHKFPATCPDCFDSWLANELDIKFDESYRDVFETKEALLEQAVRARAAAWKEDSGLVCTCLTRAITHTQEKQIISSLRKEFNTLRLQYAQALAASGKKLHSIADLERMFDTIYVNVNHVNSLEFLVFQLLEDVGEATEALKDCYTYDHAREPYSEELHIARKQNFLNALADVFSGLFGVSRKLRTTYGRHAEEYRIAIEKADGELRKSDSDRLGFAEILWSKYGRGAGGGNWESLKCPGCGGNPCDCKRDLIIGWSARKVDADQPVVHFSSDETFGEGDRDLIFISYSHKDKHWLEQLTTMLKPSLRSNTISHWDDRKIGAGVLWKEEITSALSRARVAVLLVTDYFLDSDFIHENELPPLLESASQGGTKIIWIPVRHCLYEETPLVDYQAAIDPSYPLESLSKPQRSAALKKVCQLIKQYA